MKLKVNWKFIFNCKLKMKSEKEFQSWKSKIKWNDKSGPAQHQNDKHFSSSQCKEQNSSGPHHFIELF